MIHVDTKLFNIITFILKSYDLISYDSISYMIIKLGDPLYYDRDHCGKYLQRAPPHSVRDRTLANLKNHVNSYHSGDGC